MTGSKRIASSLALILVLVVAAGCATTRAQKLGLAEPEYRVRVERNVMVPVSDGARMATDIYRPVGLAQGPTILIRTPYGKSMSGRNRGSFERMLAERGYYVLVQDVRGRFKSEGEFYPFLQDGQDGQDVIRWIEGQPWYNGKLGTHGASYLGTTQWFEAPGMDIAAMHLTVTSPDLREVLYTNGELHLNTVYFWSVMMGQRRFAYTVAPQLARLDQLVRTLPLSQADDRAGRNVPYFDQALDPQEIWSIYADVDFTEKYKQVKAPAVFVAGWYDMFLGPQLKDFNRLLEQGQGDAKASVLVVGPWGHGSGGDGSVSYGPESSQKKALGPAHTLAWFDHWLKGVDNEVLAMPRVKIFVMGENVWREEDEWPLARTVYTKYYLHSNGAANTKDGDGALSTDPPADEPPDTFIYDPLDPVPTRGGNNLGLNLGAYNQQKLEDRPDVLCYTSPELEADLEVTGPISAVIFAASDAVDTDFTVKLVDVYPDGRAVNLQDGVVRAMYRDNDPSHPTPLTPGAIEEYHLDLWATSNVFLAGHRLRVEVSSSNFPRFNRNLNTGEPPATAVDAVTANQTIHHAGRSASYLLLPIIPRGEEAGSR